DARGRDAALREAGDQRLREVQPGGRRRDRAGAGGGERVGGRAGERGGQRGDRAGAGGEDRLVALAVERELELGSFAREIGRERDVSGPQRVLEAVDQTDAAQLGAGRVDDGDLPAALAPEALE